MSPLQPPRPSLPSLSGARIGMLLKFYISKAYFLILTVFVANDGDPSTCTNRRCLQTNKNDQLSLSRVKDSGGESLSLPLSLVGSRERRGYEWRHAYCPEGKLEWRCFALKGRGLLCMFGSFTFYYIFPQHFNWYFMITNEGHPFTAKGWPPKIRSNHIWLIPWIKDWVSQYFNRFSHCECVGQVSPWPQINLSNVSFSQRAAYLVFLPQIGIYLLFPSLAFGFPVTDFPEEKRAERKPEREINGKRNIWNRPMWAFVQLRHERVGAKPYHFPLPRAWAAGLVWV